jgi:hypothetical protein
MNPQENQDYERKLQELEDQLERDRTQPTIETQPGQPPQRYVNGSQLEVPVFKQVFNQVANWFNRLPKVGKVAVVLIATIIGFSLLRSVLQLVASLISLAILGVILYLVYKFFITPQSRK